MCMLAMMPAKMISAPSALRIQPPRLLPSKKSHPTPINSGSSDMPNALYPQSIQPPLPTVTRVSSRYAPTTTIARPRKKTPIPPGVPPAPRIVPPLTRLLLRLRVESLGEVDALLQLRHALLHPCQRLPQLGDLLQRFV